MNIILNKKIITEMCGTVSFKRGDSFFKNNKVRFEKYKPDECKATVFGTEDFHVVIEKDQDGNLQTACSCPKLTSFEKECQHIAAVLLSIYEHQRNGTIPSVSHLTEGLLTLFDDQPVRSSSHQLHFETRKVLTAGFTCKPVEMAKGECLFGIALEIDGVKVENLRGFLEHVKVGGIFFLSEELIYDPNRNCFQKETDQVIQLLIQIIRDEKVYGTAFQEKSGNSDLLIPPTLCDRLVQLLKKAPKVKLEHVGKWFNGLDLTDEALPLYFDIHEAFGNQYQMEIKGLEQMTILESSRCVLFEGKLKQLDELECKRLSEFKRLLSSSAGSPILIKEEQLASFIEKVIPGLRKLGNVAFSKSITQKLMNAPLVAKLYLDRINNKLLAGLEFHYENWIFNPLERRELVRGGIFVRDIDKEEEILRLMEESSFATTDEGYFLHNEELEYEFLYHTVPKLQRLVQIYATTAVRNRISKGHHFPRIRVKVKKNRIDWLEFKFEMDGISEKQIRDILAALEEKRKYFRLPGGSLLSLETRENEEIQRFLHFHHIGGKEAANGLDLPMERCLHLLDHVEVSDIFKFEDSFLQFLETLRNPGSLTFAVPESLEPVLRDYQKQGFQWLKALAYYGFGGILADTMGLGKTVQSIAFIVSEIDDSRKNKLPVLIVCPSSLMYNWLSEIEKFAPEVRTLVIEGHKAERLKGQKESAEYDVIITSYPLLRKDIKWYSSQLYSTVIFDEAQAFKNPLTQTARAVKMLRAKNRFALTGTPVENSLEELWSIFHVVFPELFKGLKEYSKLSRENIARRIRPFLLRRKKEDVLSELPEKMVLIERTELNPEQKKLYAAYLAKLRHDTLKHLDNDTIRKNRIKILAGLTRLRQICCHPGLFVDGYKGTSAKFEQLMEIIKEAKLSGRRILIFSQFTKMLELIGRELTKNGRHFFYLDGQTPSEDRLKICERFNNGERDLFLISLKAGGTGLNLTGADTVILYDTWWNPAVEAQAADRAHRIGQKNIVQVIKMVARGTIEEKMNELQEKKRFLIREMIDNEKNMPPFLNEEELREILQL